MWTFSFKLTVLGLSFRMQDRQLWCSGSTVAAAGFSSRGSQGRNFKGRNHEGRKSIYLHLATRARPTANKHRPRNPGGQKPKERKAGSPSLLFPRWLPQNHTPALPQWKPSVQASVAEPNLKRREPDQKMNIRVKWFKSSSWPLVNLSLILCSLDSICLTGNT